MVITQRSASSFCQVRTLTCAQPLSIQLSWVHLKGLYYYDPASQMRETEAHTSQGGGCAPWAQPPLWL